MQPAFHQGELRSYGGVMTELAREAVASWRSGETRNVHEDMMALTLNIVAKLLFGANLAADARDIGTTISALMEDFSGELGLRALTPFAHLPTARGLAHPPPRPRAGSHHLQDHRRPARPPPIPGTTCSGSCCGPGTRTAAR